MRNISAKFVQKIKIYVWFSIIFFLKILPVVG